MRTVEVLHDLQGLDTAVAAERRRLAEILGVLRDRAAVDEATRHLHETDQALHLLQADLRDRELATESLRANVRDIEAKLYGGKVTSPKELGSLSDEAVQFRKLISGREDSLI